MKNTKKKPDLLLLEVKPTPKNRPEMKMPSFAGIHFNKNERALLEKLYSVEDLELYDGKPRLLTTRIKQILFDHIRKNPAQ